MWNASRFVHTLRHKEWLTCRYLISNILWSPVWLIHSNPAAVCSQHLGGKDPSSWTDKFLVTSCYCFYWPLSFPTDSLDHCKSPSLCFSACVCVYFRYTEEKKLAESAPQHSRARRASRAVCSLPAIVSRTQMRLCKVTPPGHQLANPPVGTLLLRLLCVSMEIENLAADDCITCWKANCRQ